MGFVIECSIRVYLFTGSESSLIVLLTIWRKTLEGANIGEFGEKSSNHQVFNH